MSKSLRIPDYLAHILEAIVRIESYTEDLVEISFLDNRLVQDAVIRNLEIIGEAANNVRRVDPEFAAKHHQIPWQIMYTMRNRIAHEYDSVDLEIVWKTIQRDLLELHAQIQAVYANIRSENAV